MRVERVRLRSFRSYERADVALGPGLTVVAGLNGAGKTNLLEAVYAGCTGRACRTSNERELIAFGGTVARVEVDVDGGSQGRHALAVGFERGADGRTLEKRMSVDGQPVERLADSTLRPLVSVFLPDRLELVTGPPALRRGHLDQVAAAHRPSAAGVRKAYGAALAQRNALLARIRAGHAGRGSLPAWDHELARHGLALMALRAEMVEGLRAPFAAHAAALGLEGSVSLAYRPRSKAQDAEGLLAELAEKVDSDVERGFTGHGPHRDDLVLRRAERDLRSYGSRGQQRIALLALLLAERDLLAEARGTPPLMLLDDVMSELDATRRGRLVEVLGASGQSLITATELEHVPGADRAGVARVAVEPGTARSEPSLKAVA